MKTLRIHQEEILKQARQRDNIALFLEMRLGKTLIAVRWAKEKNCQACRVITIPTAITAWKNELDDEGEIYFIAASLDKKKRIDLMLEYLAVLASGRRAWILMNFQSYAADVELFEECDYDFTALDESRFIHSSKSRINKILNGSSDKDIPQAKRSKHHAILTGAPRTESLLDVFEQLRFIRGNQPFCGCKNYWQFRNKYFEQNWKGEWVPKKGQAEFLKDVIHRIAFVRTRKDAGIPFFKSREVRYAEFNSVQKELYEQIEDDWSWTDPDSGEEFFTDLAPIRMLWLQRVCGGFTPGGKLISETTYNALAAELDEGELKGEKHVIWTRFSTEARYLFQKRAKVLRDGEYPVLLMGQEGDLKYQLKIEDQFRNDPKCKEFVVTIKKGKYSLNLSSSQTSHYFSNELAGDDRIQSEDRVLDIARTEPLLYLDYIHEGKISEVIYDMTVTKKFDHKMFMQKFTNADRRMR